ncbi:uncharacterized protein [Oscarella lobularis]|uniref:uncharacterized protein isoform X2 n=1 Tax=Oscarella lobularis TaxID=121494 RepID=UPI0033144464
MTSSKALLRFLDEGCSQEKTKLKPRIAASGRQGKSLPLPRLLPGETLIFQLDDVYCYDSLGFREPTRGILHLTDYKLSFTGTSYDVTVADDLSEKIDANDDDPERLARRGWMSQRDKQSGGRKKYAKQTTSVFFNAPKSHASLPRFPDSPSSPGFKRNSPSIMRRLKDFSLGGNRLSAAAAIELPTAPSYQSRMKSMVFDDAAVSFDENEEQEQTSCDTEVDIPLTSIYKVKKPTTKVTSLADGIRLGDCLQVISCTGTVVKFGLSVLCETSWDTIRNEIERLMRPQYFAKLFAFSYRNALNPSLDVSLLENTQSPNFYAFESEFKRLGLLDTDRYTWRSATITENLCPTYPNDVIVPSCISDLDLMRITSFYRFNRFPIVCWRDGTKGPVLLRAANTIHRRGKLSTRCEVDEAYVRALCTLTNVTQLKAAAAKVIIFTDPPLSNASKHSAPIHQRKLSREEAESFYYPESKFVYSDWVDDGEDSKIARKSFKQFRKFLYETTDAGRYYSLLDESAWLGQIHKLLSTAVEIAAAIKVQSSAVLVAYENGWDRTAQVSSLAQLLLDPFYRTLNGFQILIQKEWLSLGHKFTSRITPWLSKNKESGPIFLQFLDCVWQILRQFPRRFEFNEAFLRVIADNVYSSRFGTFLMDSEREREKKDVHKGTVSFWRWMFLNQQASNTYKNSLYEPDHGPKVLYPQSSIPSLGLWTTYYCQYRQEDHLVVAQHNVLERSIKLLRDYQELKEEFVRASTAAGVSTDDAVSGLRREVVAIPMRRTSSSDVVPNRFVARQWSAWTELERQDSDEENDDGDEEEAEAESTMTNHFGKSSTLDRRFTLSGLIIGEPQRQHQRSDANQPRSPVPFSFLDVVQKSGLSLGDMTSVKLTKAVCCGYLSKVGGRHKAWRKRWFVLDLDKHCIAYFEDEKAAANKHAPKGVIKLNEIRGAYRFDKKGATKSHFTFAVEVPHRTYFMQSSSSMGVDVWVSCISAASPLCKQ